MNETAHSGSEQGKPILFFDGVCGLCNRFVDFMLRTDRRDRFRYAPLQGETARRLLGMDDETGGQESGAPQTGDQKSADPQTGGPTPGDHKSAGPTPGDPHSFLFLENDRLFEQSNAVLLALRRLGGAWRLIVVLYVFPRAVRDFVYRIVARNRYRWFGKRDACRVPSQEEQNRFLP